MRFTKEDVNMGRHSKVASIRVLRLCHPTSDSYLPSAGEFAVLEPLLRMPRAEGARALG